ncbi:MAG: Stp1/IreP family PP2C-type Ser/Thr phosphatase [Elusimicrobiota bacterium]
MTIEYGAKSDVGQVRKNNEDNYIIDEKTGLYIVCDGMGGHSSGEVASKLAIDVIAKNFSQSVQKQQNPDSTQVMFGESNPKISGTANRLVSSIRLANQVIFESSRNYPQNQGMGTTVVAVSAFENTFIISWVGDSRVYLIRSGRIQQMSIDHSLVQEQVSKGLITDSQAESSDYKNILTRALGAAEIVEVDTIEVPASEDDYLLLCSDGLTRMLTDEQMMNVFKKFENPQNICDNLIAQANQAGGRDNVTAIVVHKKSGNIWDKFIKVVGSKTN